MRQGYREPKGEGVWVGGVREGVRKRGEEWERV